MLKVPVDNEGMKKVLNNSKAANYIYTYYSCLPLGDGLNITGWLPIKEEFFGGGLIDVSMRFDQSARQSGLAGIGCQVRVCLKIEDTGMV